VAFALLKKKKSVFT